MRGVFVLPFGVMTLAVPGVTLGVLVIVWGAYALIGGALALVAGFRLRAAGRPLWSLVIVGLLGIGAGVVTFLSHLQLLNLQETHAFLRTSSALRKTCLYSRYGAEGVA